MVFTFYKIQFNINSMNTLAKRPYTVTPDGRTGNAARMSLRMKGKPKSEEQKRKIGAGVAATALKRQLARPRNTEPLDYGKTR